jgi:hypothetical protein
MSERNQPIISGIEGTVTIHSDVDATTSAILLNNWTAIIAPTVTDDSALGYAVGSEWTDVTADKSYKLVDASVGAAVWKEITAAGGGGGATLRNVSATDTFGTANETINCTANTFTVNLPSAALIQGTTYTLVNSGIGIITLTPAVGEFINGSATIDLATQYTSRTVQSDGANWIII